MKLCKILVGTLAALSSALAAPSPEMQPVQAEERGLGFALQLISAFNTFPGFAALREIYTCMKTDEGWTADWSQEDKGKVTFKGLKPECCTMAQRGWTEYKGWSRLAKGTFESPCNGAQLTNMKPHHAQKLHAIIGDHLGE